MTEALLFAGRRALGELDEILAEKPKRASEDLAGVVRCLVELRDGLRAAGRGRDAPPEEWLSRSNAAISLVIACEYPLKGFHWKQVKEARDALEKLVAEMSAMEGRRSAEADGNRTHRPR